MPVESSPVEIRITVVDANSGEVIAQLEKLFSNLGAAGATTGQKAAKAMDEIGAHSLTSLDKVRLFRDVFAIHLPRSIEKAIASSKALMTVIGGIGQGMLALGAVEIGFHIVERLKHVWDSYFSLTIAAEKYNQEVKKARDEDFGNTRSIEDTRLRIEEATKALQKYKQEASEPVAPIAPNDLIGAIRFWMSAHTASGNAADTQGQIDKLGIRKIE